jgi:hypothetical protein
MTGIDPQDALRAAINVLRDSVESGRMPSRLKLTPEAAALHAGAADCLETRLTGEKGKVSDVPTL